MIQVLVLLLSVTLAALVYIYVGYLLALKLVVWIRAAALVLDIDRAERPFHLLAPLAADHVVHAACGEWHHKLDRTLWKFCLCERKCRQHRQRGKTREGKRTPVDCDAAHDLKFVALITGAQRLSSLATIC